MSYFILIFFMFLYSFQIFSGNRNSHSIQYNEVPFPVVTRRVTINPKEIKNNFALRMELYGCKPGWFSFTRAIFYRPCLNQNFFCGTKTFQEIGENMLIISSASICDPTLASKCLISSTSSSSDSSSRRRQSSAAVGAVAIVAVVYGWLRLRLGWGNGAKFTNPNPMSSFTTIPFWSTNIFIHMQSLHCG